MKTTDLPTGPVKPDRPHILFVNPWIHDFAAYDFWAKPIGLLTLAAIARRQGWTVSYIDCLDRFHPRAPRADSGQRGGRGPYLKTAIEKPAALKDVPRRYSRYGIPPGWFREDLMALEPPDLVCVTSQMTYWYPGVRETIAVIRDTFENTRIILGGIYATLCEMHACRHSGADRVITGPGESRLLDIVSQETGFSAAPDFDAADLDSYPYPAFDLQPKIAYVPLLTSRGCPFACSYCASHILQPERMRRNPAAVVEEIRYWHGRYRVSDFAFYDDALLVDSDRHAVPMLEKIVAADLGLRFHTPNAIHIREITPENASLMYRAGFETIRLGLETTAFEQRKKLDAKVTASEFFRAVSLLKDAGFNGKQIGAYLLVGLPGQTIDAVGASIRSVRQCHIRPIPAYYSPIPGTALWPRAQSGSRYDLASDPLFTNNAVFPCMDGGFSWDTLSLLKAQAAG